jgi:hypothetical protein
MMVSEFMSREESEVLQVGAKESGGVRYRVNYRTGAVTLVSAAPVLETYLLVLQSWHSLSGIFYRPSPDDHSSLVSSVTVSAVEAGGIVRFGFTNGVVVYRITELGDEPFSICRMEWPD